MNDSTPTPTRNYNQLLSEAQEIITEYEFTSRWSLIEGYHKLGEHLQGADSITVTRLAHDLNKSEQTLTRAIRFYQKYPDLTLLPEGKNVSWHRLVNKYLPETSKPKEEISKCSLCGGRIDSPCHSDRAT